MFFETFDCEFHIFEDRENLGIFDVESSVSIFLGILPTLKP